MEERSKPIGPEEAHFVVPAGETGVGDYRDAMPRGGHGRVEDPVDPKPTDRRSHAGELGPDLAALNTTKDVMERDMNSDRTVDKSGKSVDGFADTEGPTEVASPDPGAKRENEPLDPDEYAKEQREARSEEDDK